MGSALSDIEVCTDVAKLQNYAQIGYLYILEGSTLGGQFLSRAVEKILVFTAEYGASYFNSYGTANLGYMWKYFQQLLIDFVHNPETETEIMQSAAITFQKLDKWLA